MKLNNKVTMIIAFIVLLIFVVLAVYFKANPKTTDEVLEESYPVSALDKQNSNVIVSEEGEETYFDFSKNYVYSAPNDVTEPRFGLTVAGTCKFKTNSIPVEFLPNSDGSLYTLSVNPNFEPSIDTSKITTNYESTFTNAEYIVEGNKIVIYFSGTFTFSDGTNTFTHDVIENFEMSLEEYLN